MRSMAGDGSGEARLLVVDDEETILELLSGSLRLAGFEVTTAANGTEALRVAAASRPDLVLLDVMMPNGVPRRPRGYASPTWNSTKTAMKSGGTASSSR
jgi:CheY-like chemotaxis protein